MTKRLKLFLAILLGSAAIACLAAGCKVGQPGREEVLADYNGGQVTYYANGGCFDSNTSIVVRELYYKDADVPFFDIKEKADSGQGSDEEATSINIFYSGYEFTGWYLPARYESGEHAGEIMYTYTYTNSSNEVVTVPAYPRLNEDGSPVTDSTEARPVFYIDGSNGDILERNVKVVASEELIDSSYLVKAEEKLVVCAAWKPALKFVFKLAVEEDGDYVYNGTTYHKGDTISTVVFGKNTTANPGQSATVSFDNMTFVSNYTEEECLNYAGDFNRADYEGQTEIVIWSKFIKGSWTIVRNNPNEIKSMFNGLSSSSNAYYLLEDVDCSTITDFGTRLGVRAKIEGNGHTLSNLNFNPSTSLANGAVSAPVFGTIYATAQISNLKLSNIQISVKGLGDLNFFAICSTVEEGAVIQNLCIENVTATVKIPNNRMVINAQGGDRSRWIFGGKETDEAFLSAYDVTLTGTNTLTIE
ncbi:MAG: hypothetical protein ACI4MC_00210 [Candidatus Coproplasma sp.]